MKTLDKCRDLLKDINISDSKLIHLEAEMKIAKRNINEILELNESNDYRKIINFSMTDNDFKDIFPGTYNIIDNNISEEEFSIVNNNIYGFHKGKLSKRLSKIKFTNTEQEVIANETGSYNLMDVFDIVKPKNIVISTNIYDFFTSATRATFRSCYALDGSHFNGNIAYMRDNFTFMIYTSSSKLDKKIGRMFAYMYGKNFITSRVYGSMYQAEIGVAVHYIREKMNSEDNWKISINFDVPYSNARPMLEFPIPVFFDVDYTKLHYTGSLNYVDVLQLDFHNSLCLNCGCDTINGYYGVCQSCQGNIHRCCNCNKPYHIDTSDNEDYCSECIEELFIKCEKCGITHNRNSFSTINGITICRNCVYANYKSCIRCGSYILNTEVKFYNGSIVCDECNVVLIDEHGILPDNQLVIGGFELDKEIEFAIGGQPYLSYLDIVDGMDNKYLRIRFQYNGMICEVTVKDTTMQIHREQLPMDETVCVSSLIRDLTILYSNMSQFEGMECFKLSSAYAIPEPILPTNTYFCNITIPTYTNVVLLGIGFGVVISNNYVDDVLVFRMTPCRGGLTKTFHITAQEFIHDMGTIMPDITYEPRNLIIDFIIVHSGIPEYEELSTDIIYTDTPIVRVNRPNEPADANTGYYAQRVPAQPTYAGYTLGTNNGDYEITRSITRDANLTYANDNGTMAWTTVNTGNPIEQALEGLHDAYDASIRDYRQHVEGEWNTSVWGALAPPLEPLF